jgi:hypothetical protein
VEELKTRKYAALFPDGYVVGWWLQTLVAT